MAKDFKPDADEFDSRTRHQHDPYQTGEDNHEWNFDVDINKWLKHRFVKVAHMEKCEPGGRNSPIGSVCKVMGEENLPNGRKAYLVEWEQTHVVGIIFSECIIPIQLLKRALKKSPRINKRGGKPIV